VNSGRAITIRSLASETESIAELLAIRVRRGPEVKNGRLFMRFPKVQADHSPDTSQQQKQLADSHSNLRVQSSNPLEPVGEVLPANDPAMLKVEAILLLQCHR
jgi:hypothetical protein